MANLQMDHQELETYSDHRLAALLRHNKDLKSTISRLLHLFPDDEEEAHDTILLQKFDTFLEERIYAITTLRDRHKIRQVAVSPLLDGIPELPLDSLNDLDVVARHPLDSIDHRGTFGHVSSPAALPIDRGERILSVPPQELESDTTWLHEVKQKLTDVFKLESFRENQLEAITATMRRQDVFVLMPTGGGKSLCFQLPAVCDLGRTRGVTVVVEPLISLIDDQVQALREKNISVESLHSEVLENAHGILHRLCDTSRQPRLLYVTPETIRTNAMKTILGHLDRQRALARFVVDEAHCISEWGRDFRQAYQALCVLRETFPAVPIMALTGTASKRVSEDIVTCLGIPGCVRLRQSFNRPNLNYAVVRQERDSIHKIAESIQEKYSGETGIIYCRSRSECEKVAKTLTERYNISTEAYHARVPQLAKRDVLQAWQNGSCQVVAATTAFGMGIDKPDVRFVIHNCVPRSLEGYYQETGRAGRDGKPSDCILYYRYRDGESLFAAVRNKEGLSTEGKRAAQEGIRQVVEYCQNVTDCRRCQLLTYFEEIFDSRDCNGHCDNCRDSRSIISEDVTEVTRSILLVISRKVFRITTSQLVDTIKGSMRASLTKKSFQRLPIHGLCKNWNERRQRLIELMIAKQLLTIYSITNAKNWPQTYLQIGPKAVDFILTGSRLTLDSRETVAQDRGAQRLRRTGHKKRRRYGASDDEDFEPNESRRQAKRRRDSCDAADLGNAPTAARPPRKRCGVREIGPQASRHVEDEDESDCEIITAYPAFPSRADEGQASVAQGSQRMICEVVITERPAHLMRRAQSSRSVITPVTSKDSLDQDTDDAGASDELILPMSDSEVTFRSGESIIAPLPVPRDLE